MDQQRDLKNLAWNRMNGLLPAIVQDADDGRVLMLGYMNAQALEKTLESRRVTFHSRSKNRLWTKGETSGNTLELVDLVPDCDFDALLVRARPAGPVCHLGTETCFGNTRPPPAAFLGHLAKVIESRREASPEESYTAGLLAQGIERCAQKIGEEGVEVALAAVSGDEKRLVAESADLLYHLLVGLAAGGVGFEDVIAELAGRHGKKQ